MDAKLLQLIDKKIGHTRKLTETKRTINFIRWVGNKIQRVEIVIDIKNPRILALRREVKRMNAKGWKIW